MPISFVLIDPAKEIDLSHSARYAFVSDVTTCEDRRLEGHFRALMDHTYDRMRQAGMPLLLLRGETYVATFDTSTQICYHIARRSTLALGTDFNSVSTCS